jgi:hypothetical protein
MMFRVHSIVSFIVPFISTATRSFTGRITMSPDIRAVTKISQPSRGSLTTYQFIRSKHLVNVSHICPAPTSVNSYWSVFQTVDRTSQSIDSNGISSAVETTSHYPCNFYSITRRYESGEASQQSNFHSTALTRD